MNFLQVMLFFWYPVSIGMMDGINQFVLPGVTWQHLIILIFLLFGFSYVKVDNVLRERIFLFIYSLMCVHSLFFSLEFGTVFKLFAYLGLGQLAFCFVRNMSFGQFVGTLARSALFFMILSVAYIFLFHSQSYEFLQGREVISSFYGQKNVYGRFLQVNILLFVVMYSLSGKMRWVVFSLLAAVLLEMSKARSAMAMAVLSLLVYWVVLRQITSVKLMVFVAIMMLLIMLYLIGNDYIYTFGLGSIYDGISVLDSVEIYSTGRLTVWDAIIQDISSEGKWMLGYGYGQFFSGRSEYALTMLGLGDFLPNDSHNGYIDVVVNFGLVGAVVYFLAIAYFVRKYASSADVVSAFAIAFLACFVFANMTESYLVKTTNFYGFLFWAMLLARWNLRKQVIK